MVLKGYWAVLREHRTRRMFLFAMLAGLPAGVLPLALVVFISRETGSVVAAALTLAAELAGIAAGAPVWTRLADRRGQSRVIGPLAATNALLLGAMVALVASGAPRPAFVAAAFAAGLAYPPIGASLRAISATLESVEQRRAAYALQSVSVEVIYIAGPVIAAAVIAAGSPGAAVLTAACMSLIGGLAFAASEASRGWKPTEGSGGRLGALASPGVRTLLLGAVALGAVLGGLDVTVPAFAGEHGRAEAAGVALSALAVGSAIGGLLYGGRAWARAPAEQYGYGFAGLGIALAFLTVAGSLPILAGLMFVAGLGIAPLSAIAFSLVDDVAPDGTATETTGWIVTAYTLGAGLGAVVAGVLADELGVEIAFLASSASALIGAAATRLRRRTLASPQVDGTLAGRRAMRRLALEHRPER
jgi:MFS family permease